MHMNIVLCKERYSLMYCMSILFLCLISENDIKTHIGYSPFYNSIEQVFVPMNAMNAMCKHNPKARRGVSCVTGQKRCRYEF